MSEIVHSAMEQINRSVIVEFHWPTKPGQRDDLEALVEVIKLH